MKLLTKSQIQAILPGIDLMRDIEAGFAAYSAGRAVVPPVGELLLEESAGEVHLKYGYIKGEPYYVIKIASGFYNNPKLGLPSSNGLMLLFSQKTGELVAVLHDEGLLTDIRTAVAGAIAAKYLGPHEVVRIGIVGTGIQARLQLEYLKAVTDCRQVLVWGRRPEAMAAFQAEMADKGFAVEAAADAAALLSACNLIVTTTPATEPVLVGTIPAGTHITAMGSDTPHKQELDSAMLAQADLVVADAIPQCLSRGEIYQAIEAGTLTPDNLVELGTIINGQHPGRTSDSHITIADLTGVAVQDIMITQAVYSRV